MSSLKRPVEIGTLLFVWLLSAFGHEIRAKAALDGRPHRIAAGQIDIGNAVTEMSEAMGQGVPQADGGIRTEPRMDVAHVARAVVQMAALPLDANIPFMTIMATNMPLFGRG